MAGYFADASGRYHGFLEERGTYTTIDVSGAADIFLDGINNLGIIQGQIIDAAGLAEGFVTTRRGLFSIVDYPGSGAAAIVGINDLGNLCGAYGPAGFESAKTFIAILQ